MEIKIKTISCKYCKSQQIVPENKTGAILCSQCGAPLDVRMTNNQPAVSHPKPIAIKQSIKKNTVAPKIICKRESPYVSLLKFFALWLGLFIGCGILWLLCGPILIDWSLWGFRCLFYFPWEPLAGSINIIYLLWDCLLLIVSLIWWFITTIPLIILLIVSLLILVGFSQQ
jgi:hypothetical protein